MTGRADPAETLAEALAYVDNCLDAPARRAFEARLGGDAELRREVAQWQAQNREIRCAFGAPARDPLDLGSASNENGVRRSLEAVRRPEAAVRQFGHARALRSPTQPAPDWRRDAPGAILRDAIALLTLSVALLAAAPPGFGPRPPPALLEAGLAAAHDLGPLPVEFSADDPALARRLGPRLALAPPAPQGLRLLGARLVPGVQAAAALFVYQDGRGERATLMIEPLDEIGPAPARRGAIGALSAIAWTGAGYGFVAASTQPDDIAALSNATALGR
jgi:anti-sigma factor RsiW